MPLVITIEPDNFSPLVLNVNSFHVVDVLYYLNACLAPTHHLQWNVIMDPSFCYRYTTEVCMRAVVFGWEPNFSSPM